MLVVLLTVVLIGVMAFVTDFGMAYANQRSVQNGADAAALAVGRRIALTAGTGNCAAIAGAYNTTATRAVAGSMFSKNAPGATLSGGASGFVVGCEAVKSNPHTLVVKITGEQRSPAFFGGIFGTRSLTVKAKSRVVVGPLGSVLRVRPFAICETFADSVRDTPGATFVVPVTQANAGCGAAPGNWAMMDFNGGSNATADLKNWLVDGFEHPVSVSPPLLVNGDPGFNVNAATTEMDTMFTTHDIVLPVFSSVTGTGNTAQFNIVGFISVKPCRYRINNKTGPNAADVNPGCGPLPATPPADYLQLKYSFYIPIGSVSETCELGEDMCDDGPRGTTLAD